MKKIILIGICMMLCTTIFSFTDTISVSAYSIIGNTVSFENQYGKLEVYPFKTNNIIRQKQYYNLTWKYPNNIIDIAFCFNDSLTYGKVFYWNGSTYNNVSFTHIEYGGKHYYVRQNIAIANQQKITGYWEYDIPVGSSGKWDLYAKLSSDSISTAFSTGRYIHIDPWWNSSYGYLSGSSISNYVVNYTIPINISYNIGGDLAMHSKCQTNFSDIRFLSEDNSTELYHWVEYSVTGSYALFWVNISDEDYVNCYYGKTPIGNSSYNNPSNVFYMWENFTSITDWTNYAGGGFSVYSGILVLTSSAVHKYMYKDIGQGDYRIKTKIKVNSSSSASTQNGIQLEQDVTTTWADITNNEMQMVMYGRLATNAYGNAKSNGGTAYPVAFNCVDNVWYKMDVAYNDDVNIRNINNYVVGTNSVSGMSVYPRYLFIRTRAVTTMINNVDWLFVSKHAPTEPTFSSWTVNMSYGQYAVNLYNESPSNFEIVNGINISYLSVELTVLDGQANSINISVNADNGLFYDNETVGVYNDSYSLNVFSANFSVATLYTWYVNVTDGSWNVNFIYYFNTSQLVQYDNWQVLDYKLELIYSAINTSNIKNDTEDILTYLSGALTIDNSQFYLLVLISLWAFFIFLYEEKQKNIYSICIVFLGLPLGLIISGIAFYNSYPFGYLISFIIILISFLIPAYSQYKGKKK